MPKQTRPSSTPVPIRFSERMLAEIKEVASELEMSTQDVIRLSVAAGIKALKAIGYDGIAEAVAQQIIATGEPQAPKSGKRGKKGE